VVNYLYFLPVGAALALGLHVVHPGAGAPLWLAPAIFFGMLWTVVLSEEFLFRGVLQEWLEEWTCPRWAALALASLAFARCISGSAVPQLALGAAHRRPGLVLRRARNQAGDIRAGMVTHALAIATWMGFFAR